MDKAKTQTTTPEAGARVMTIQHKQVKPLIESQGSKIKSKEDATLYRLF